MFIDVGGSFPYSSTFLANVLLLIFREGAGEGDRKINDEKDGSAVFCTPILVCPDRESEGDLLVHGTMLSQLSHSSCAYSSI